MLANRNGVIVWFDTDSPKKLFSNCYRLKVIEMFWFGRNFSVWAANKFWDNLSTKNNRRFLGQRRIVWRVGPWIEKKNTSADFANRIHTQIQIQNKDNKYQREKGSRYTSPSTERPSHTILLESASPDRLYALMWSPISSDSKRKPMVPNYSLPLQLI